MPSATSRRSNKPFGPGTKPTRVLPKLREFLFGARKSLLLGMHRFCFLSEASWKTYFCFYSCYFFHDIVVFYLFSILTYYFFPEKFCVEKGI